MNRGLEGVVVAETVLSDADSAAGKLWIRGVPLADLVAHHGYEGTVALLWEGFAGQGLDRAGIQRTLGAARADAFARLNDWLPMAPSMTTETGVRLCIAALPDDCPPASIVAALTVAVAALERARDGQPPVPPDPALSTAADFLRMLRGSAPDPAAVRALDTYFTSMAESGVGASTFAARVIASTRASVSASVLGALCAFSGPLHGGAPAGTLDLLDELQAADGLDAAIERKLGAGERLMGFGHRLFRGNDPRAEALRAALRQMGSAAKQLAFAERVEARVAAIYGQLKPGRKLPANVELMASLMLDAVGIRRDAFTVVFAVARSPGWIAHALEQQQIGRIFRPASHYIGPQHE